MKTKFFIIAFLSFLTFSFAQSKFIKLSTEISKNTDFISLSNNLNNFETKKIDIKTLNSLANKEKLSNEEQIIFAKSLGFSSFNEFEKFSEENTKYIKSVASKFALQNYTNEDLNTIINESFIIVNHPEDLQQAYGRTCEQRLRTCKIGSKALYFLELGGCAGLGLGIAGTSLGSASAVGVGVSIICSGAAAVHLGSMLDACQDAYDDCKEK